MNRNQNPLTNEEIQRLAPSAFAGQPYEKQSSRYSFVPTIDVIEGMRQAGFQPVMATQSHTQIAGKRMFTKHMIRFRSTDELPNVGDSRLETVMVNSHDGTSSYELMMGVFVLVCGNGMVVSEGMCQSVRVRHVGNITESIIEASLGLLRQGPKIQDAMNLWKSIILTVEEQLALAESVHMLRFEEGSNLATAIAPDKLLEPRRFQDNKSDLWSVTNRLQENTIRGGARGQMPRVNIYQRPRRVKSQAVTGIDQNVKLNKAIWALSEKMAELKHS